MRELGRRKGKAGSKRESMSRHCQKIKETRKGGKKVGEEGGEEGAKKHLNGALRGRTAREKKDWARSKRRGESSRHGSQRAGRETIEIIKKERGRKGNRGKRTGGSVRLKDTPDVDEK